MASRAELRLRGFSPHTKVNTSRVLFLTSFLYSFLVLFFLVSYRTFPIFLVFQLSRLLCLVFSVWVLIEDSLRLRISLPRLPFGISYRLFGLGNEQRHSGLALARQLICPIPNSQVFTQSCEANNHIISQPPTRCPTFPPTPPSRLRRRSRSRNRGFPSERPPRSGHHSSSSPISTRPRP